MKVLLVDDHLLFSSGLKNLLEAGEIEVAGIACNGEDALVAVRELQPEVVLMDIQMPGCDGLTATRLIKSEFPAVKIVILSMNHDNELVFEAIKNGASGFLLKNLGAEEFFDLLEGLARGETIFSPELAGLLLKELVPAEDGDFVEGHKKKEGQVRLLTPRQEEVLLHIARGLTYKETSELLYISPATVKYHMNEILERLHLETRAQAITYAARIMLTGMEK